MATAYVSIGPVAGKKIDSGDFALFAGSAVQSETITTSGTSAAGSLTAPSDRCAAQIFVGSAVYAVSGIAPTASASSGVYVPANMPIQVALKKGEKIALIDA